MKEIYHHDDRDALAEAAYHERRRASPNAHTTPRYTYDPDAQDAVEPSYDRVHYPTTLIERWD